MTMDTNETAEVIDAFAQYPRCFAEEELLSFASADEERQQFLQIISNDYRFLHSGEGTSGEKHFIAKQVLYRWYIELNIKLARVHKARLDDRQLALSMNFLRLDGRWNVPPPPYIEFGQLFSLVRPTLNSSEYIFPLARLLSFMTPSKIKTAREILGSFNKMPWLELPSEQMILELIEDTLVKLTRRERYIITRRAGLFGNTKMTLEQLGKEFNLTRERIRQIESKTFNKFRHPTYTRKLIAALLFYAVFNNGSMLVPSGAMKNTSLFVAKYNNIPVSIFPHTNVAILGMAKEDMAIPNHMWKLALDPNEIASELQKSSRLSMDKGDLRVLAKRLAVYIQKRITKTQKVYLALKSISRPAHYADIAEAYHSIFPEDEVAEHSIHAKLTYNPYGIVWIGVRGTYALEEWGYKRPSLSLFNTITEIVERKYSETNNSVPYSVIVAELGKYRKVINPNSVVFATCYNPRLIQIEGNCYIPKPIEEFETDAAVEALDRILQEFEEQFGGHYSQGDA